MNTTTTYSPIAIFYISYGKGEHSYCTFQLLFIGIIDINVFNYIHI
jgi:hypothetical protein